MYSYLAIRQSLVRRQTGLDSSASPELGLGPKSTNNPNATISPLGDRGVGVATIQLIPSDSGACCAASCSSSSAAALRVSRPAPGSHRL